MAKPYQASLKLRPPQSLSRADSLPHKAYHTDLIVEICVNPFKHIMHFLHMSSSAWGKREPLLSMPMWMADKLCEGND